MEDHVSSSETEASQEMESMNGAVLPKLTICHSADISEHETVSHSGLNSNHVS